MASSPETVLITGASSGIGRACALRLAGEGRRLVLVSRNEDRLVSLAEIIRKQSEDGNQTETLIIPYDLTDSNGVRVIYDHIADRGWKLTGMVYAAGELTECPVKANQLSMLERAMSLHCFSFYEMGRLFYHRKYSEESSSIVAVSTIATHCCDKGQGPYTTSKIALEASVLTMAREFLPRHIRVNAIQPATVDTPLTESKLQQMGRSREDVEREQPLGFITPEAVAELAAFLLSDKASYITGARIPISGGMDFGGF